jgi:hypothetical protein
LLGLELGASLFLFGSRILVLPGFVLEFFHNFFGLSLELFFSLGVGVNGGLKFGVFCLPQGFQLGLLVILRGI